MEKRWISFLLTLCMLFSLLATPAAAASNQSEVVTSAIVSYVSQGTFKSSYCGKAWGCFAFCNYVWKNVFGYDYYAEKYTGIATNEPSGNVYQFLTQNNAKAGDILWCHTSNNSITHNMIVLAYDSSGIWLSDATAGGKLWHNNVKISYNSADYKQYFGGDCFLKLYKVNDNLWNSVSSNRNTSGTPTTITGVAGKTSKPSVSVNGQTVTASWTYSGSATKFDVYLVQDPWRWEDIKYQTSVTGNSCAFNNVAPGEYQMFTIARPNTDYVQSEWSSTFSVNSAAASVVKSTLQNGTYSLSPKCADGMCLDVADGSGSDEANVQIYRSNGTEAQQWEFTSLNNGYYTIASKISDKALDVAHGWTESGTNVWQYEKNGSEAQQWQLQDAGDGYYYLIPRLNTQLCLDVDNAGNTNETNVQVWVQNQTDAQKWKITPVNTTQPTSTGASSGTALANTVISGNATNNLNSIVTATSWDIVNIPRAENQPEGWYQLYMKRGTTFQVQTQFWPSDSNNNVGCFYWLIAGGENSGVTVNESGLISASNSAQNAGITVQGANLGLKYISIYIID